MKHTDTSIKGDEKASNTATSLTPLGPSYAASSLDGIRLIAQ